MTRLAAALALAAAFLLARPAAAKETASAAVKTANEKLRSALDAYVKSKGEDRKAARAGVRHAVDSLLDFKALVKAAAGKHWGDMKPTEQHRFTEALRGVMEANYLVKGRESGEVDVAKVKTEVTGEEPREGQTLVKTTLQSGDDSAKVDYVLEHHGKHWRAVDVITEGASLVESYRDQIQELWPTKGFAGVVKSLEKKRSRLEAKLEAETAPKAAE